MRQKRGTLGIHKVRLALEFVIKVISNIVTKRVLLLARADNGVGLRVKESVDGVVPERCGKRTSHLK